MTPERPVPPRRRAAAMWIVNAGLMAIFAATLLALTMHAAGWWRYLYGAGALALIAGRLMSPYRGDIYRVKRLSRIEVWSAIFFCVAVFFMFYPGANNRDWLAFTLAGGVIQVYTSVMIPYIESRHHKGRQAGKK
ncbi:MAG: hypothetical protein NC117_03295 [Pseudoflavonifractor sp.]|nr:hypothetical protein [Pseudoflavonifractor sp.]